MKPKLFDRILLVLLSLFTLLLALGLFGVALKLIPVDILQYYLEIIYQNPVNSLIVGGVGIILFAVSLRLLFARNRKPAEPKQPTATLVRATEFGSTFISLGALDAMVQKHCRSNGRIRDCVSSITTAGESGVSIGLKLALLPDTNIPELTSNLQKTLKEYIQSNSGIQISEIGIMIIPSAIPQKMRVE